MQNAIVNVNGQIFQPEESDKAKVSVFDRAYLYGDSLYEVMRTYDGKFFELDAHLQRMEKSAALCRMILGQSLSVYKEQAERTLQAFYERQNKTAKAGEKTEAYCRIILSRGEGKIGFGLSCLTTPTQYVIIVQPLEEPSAEMTARGAHLQISNRLRNDPRALDPAMKSGNYLNSLLAYLEAAAESYDDALMCNSDGHLTEGTTFNLFYIRRGIIATSPLEIGILDGITRKHLFEVAGSLKIPHRIVRFPRERLYEADEVFLTSTIKEVFPITRIDGRKICNGKPGALTMKLRKSFREFALAKIAQGAKS
jgi:branched-chain amino acid aminotransferase